MTTTIERMPQAFTGGPPLLDTDLAAFRRDFDQRSFALGHHLANDPLFEPARLLQLAKAMAETPGDVYYDAGDVRVDQRWDEVPVCDMPIDRLLHQIETAGAWIILRKAEKFPEYAYILEACMAEIERLAGRNLRRLMKVRHAIIFISSPNRVTSYHIDRECNFLFQIRGSKTVSVFDRNDRDVLPEAEIERFWAVDNNAAVYRPEFQSRAAVYELTPGSGVHIPVNCPHWVQNGPEVSISVSINFHYHDSLLGDVYRTNYWLRRAGLRPLPPRRVPAIDSVKRTLYSSARSLKSTTRSVLSRVRPR